MWLVTVKLPRNRLHDPRNKKEGECPVNTDYACTDITGAHHSVIAEREMIPSKRRKVHRVKYGSANSLTLDAQGRIALPSALRAYAQIENNAVIVGASNYIEIWNPPLWNAEKASSEEEVYQIIENLEGQQ